MTLSIATLAFADFFILFDEWGSVVVRLRTSINGLSTMLLAFQAGLIGFLSPMQLFFDGLLTYA